MKDISIRQWPLISVLTLIVGLLLGAWWLVTAPPAYADTLTVWTTADSGVGSLRWAVTNASSGDTIVFLSGLTGSTITLSSEIVIDKDLTITGLGANDLTVSGGGNNRVFRVVHGATVTITDMAITNGSAEQGGGVYNAGTLTLTDCLLTSNMAVDETNASTNGGAIINAGTSTGKATLTIERCTIENNNSEGEGGGIGNVTYSDTVAELTVRDSTIANNNANYGGGVAVYAQSGGAADATFINTTVSVNDASADGGGFDIDVLGTGTMARATLINTTVYNNTAGGDGGGINALKDGSSLVLRNSIVAGNTAGSTGSDIYQGGVDTDIVLYGGNVIGSDDGISLYSTGPNDQVGTAGSPIAPVLGPLADNGGPTQTHIPLTSSPAIDAGLDSTCTATDQRGESRPADGDGDSSAVCDSGAVEVQPGDLAAVTRCGLQEGETVHFGATGVSAEIATLGSLDCLEVTLTAENHPQATGGEDGEALMTGRYWTITETAGATDWSVNLSLLHNDVLNPKACKYPGNMGGAGWDCAATSATNRFVVRNGVTSFSDWAVGSDVSPTAIFMRRVSTAMQREVAVPVGWLVALGLALATGGLWWQRRRNG